MTQNFLENVKIYLFSQAVSRTAWYILVIAPKKHFDF